MKAQVPPLHIADHLDPLSGPGLDLLLAGLFSCGRSSGGLSLLDHPLNDSGANPKIPRDPPDADALGPPISDLLLDLSADPHSFKGYGKDADGNEFQNMEMTATRQ